MACECTCSVVFVSLLVTSIVSFIVVSSVPWHPWSISDLLNDHWGSPAIINVGGESHLTSELDVDWAKACLAFLILAMLSLFVTLVASCGICCTCCRNRIPAIIMIVTAGVAALWLLVSLIIWTAEGKPSGTSFAYGYIISWLLFFIILVVPILGGVTLKLKGDIVTYKPKMIIVTA